MDLVELIRYGVVPIHETADLARLLIEGFDDANAGDRIAQHIRQAGPLSPRANEPRVERFTVPVNHPAEERHRQRHDETKPPVEREQDGA